jgi:hypothetical protein
LGDTMVKFDCPVCLTSSLVPINKVSAGKKTCSVKCRVILFPPPHKIRPLMERFWEKVDKNGPTIRPELGPCWLWTGAKKELGYGVINDGGKIVRASRVSFEHHIRKLEPGEEACHKCDNPPCIHPEHLFAGTHGDNMRDMYAKGRKRWRKTHCVRGHERTGTGSCLECKSTYRARNLAVCRRYETEYRDRHREHLREYMRQYHQKRKGISNE